MIALVLAIVGNPYMPSKILKGLKYAPGRGILSLTPVAVWD
jgi:hypothetical protein